MDNLKIFSLNVQGLNDPSKRRIIFKWLEDNQCKIAFLQETFCKNEFPKNSHPNWTIKHNFSNSTHSRGVAIMFHNSLNFDIKNIHKKEDARVILINASIENVEVSLCNIYAPNDPSNRKEYFRTLKYWIARHADHENDLIMGGDMNCAINENDRQNIRGNVDVSRNAMKGLIKDLDLIDTWYTCHDKPQFTYTDVQNGSKSRIDYLFLSNSIKHKVKKISLKHAPKKDKHKSVCLTIKLHENKKGPGYWKLNEKLMDLPEFDVLIDRIIADILLNYTDLNHRLKWELFKIHVQECSIRLGIDRARLEKEYVKRLQNNIDALQRDEDNGLPIDRDLKNEYISNLNKHYKEKDDGYIIRAKAQWVNEGERSTKYFFNLEKERQKNNVIRQLKKVDGTIIKEDEEILTETGVYYDKLFETKNIPQEEIINYLEDTNFENILNENEQTFCDQQITQEEISKVIKNLKCGKSPGCDGLTPEFYKKYWNKISKLYMNMVHETYTEGELPYTLRKALIALLFKKGDPLLLKNYRPISLTNYDYKIICFVLANRMQSVLGNIIHEDQTGYIKNRYIGTNARLLEDYFEHCENFKIPGILLFLDFEKAFDSVEWNFMAKVLEKFNFGEGFRKWVKILYTKPIISIKNNGWLSHDIKLTRGVRQGCPLSALLFVLTVEVMAIKIRANTDIHGFQCSDENIKESLYADDTTLLLADLDSLDKAIDTVENFSKVAGPKLNVEKTEGILLGPLKDSIPAYRGIKFTNEAIRVLGVYMGHDKHMCHTKNWEDKLSRIRIVFERWKHRNLTIFGKSLIIKSLAISKLIHTMSIIETPDDILKEIEKLIFNFLWDSKDRIKRKTLIGQKLKGGINMIDIYCKEKAIKAGWIKRLSKNGPNSNFVNMYLRKYGIDCDYLVKTTCTKFDIYKETLKLPQFWAKVFAYANECKTLKTNDILTDSDFLCEPIWFNKRILLANKPVFISNWTKSSIRYVKDLFDHNGQFINEDYILNKLENTANWMAEFSKVKKMFKKLLEVFKTDNAPYVNIRNTWTLLHNNSLYCMKTQKSTFYYKILIDKKYTRNYMEDIWEREFNIEINWQDLYMTRVWKISDRKLAEFNYKLICNIINTRSIISKWNRNIHENCPFCGIRQTTRHLLYECSRVHNLWIMIGTILKMNITYKHLVIGNIPRTEYIIARNLVISYIAYGIYKFWIMSENQKVNFNHDCLTSFIRRDIFSRTVYVNNDIFKNICDRLLSEL